MNKEYESPGRGFVVIVGAVPPPVTGAALVTQRMADLLASVGAVETIPFVRPRRTGTLAGILARAMSMLVGVRRVIQRDCVSVYLALPGGSSVLALYPVVAAARVRGLPIYLHHHSYAYLHGRSNQFAGAFRLAGRHATHVVLCESMDERLRRLYRVRESVEISNLAWVEIPEPKTLSRGDNFTLGHLSNLSIEKGLDDLISHYERVQTHDSSVRLKLAGPPASDRERNLIKGALQLPGVEYLGPIGQADLGDFFADIDLFVFPSRYRNEALPLVVLEALLHGVPCVVYPIGCLPQTPGVTVATPGHIDDAILEARYRSRDRQSLASETRHEAQKSRTSAQSLAREIAQAPAESEPRGSQ